MMTCRDNAQPRRIISAAGVSSGIDATLHVIGRLHGDNVAREVAQYLEFTQRAE
jgi:transcriptional regulator GlxA family with amidase domain